MELLQRWWSQEGRGRGEAALRRELYFFSLYRLLEAGLLAFIAFSPFGDFFAELRNPALAKTMALAYVVVTLVLLMLSRDARHGLARVAGLGLGADIVAALIAIHTMDGIETGVALLLVFNIAAGGLLMPLRPALLLALAAAAGLIAEFAMASEAGGRNIAEPLMFGLGYLGIALLTHQLGEQMRATQKLVDQREVDLANLSQVNEMIIRRMRTGLLVVDEANRVRMYNEAAWHLIGNPRADQRALALASPELSRLLWHWRNRKLPAPQPVALSPGVPEVIPRFMPLGGNEAMTLVFLEDTSLFSRRAEELTLSTLGRLSASIAHEIRNPLAAISYSAQLLEECEQLLEPDRRLVEIINQQCQRMNGIVHSILGMARRERAQPTPVELGGWAQRFVNEFRSGKPLDDVELEASSPSTPVRVLADSEHLHQVATILVSNAIDYGRLPGQPARITVSAHPATADTGASLTVVDRGPGIPPKVVGSIFDPFFTTSEHGTGLGLYIATQLCEANQATLGYERVAGGGSCFRIAFQHDRP